MAMWRRDKRDIFWLGTAVMACFKDAPVTIPFDAYTKLHIRNGRGNQRVDRVPKRHGYYQSLLFAKRRSQMDKTSGQADPKMICGWLSGAAAYLRGAG